MIEGLIIDSFAGGGGASTGITMALGRSPDIAINHDAEALALHAANHPETVHYSKNIWQVDPLDAVGNRPVALAWFSPDCKHFSKAKGGKPVKRNIRDLAWVIVRWAKQVRPAVIMVENVEEFQTWGPLITLVDGAGAPILSKDGDKQLIPDPARKGQTFREWTQELRRLGYRCEWKELRACDYGAPTIRKRFFMVARRDGKKIAWPKPTHGDPKSAEVISGKLLPWRTAAQIIDWSLPCPSIFLTREEGRALGVKRPLEEATMTRIAKGVKRYVIEAERPFIVNLTHQGGDRTEPVDEPFKTVTGAHRGEKAVVAPIFTYAQHGGTVRDPAEPHSTITASTKDNNSVIAPVIVRTAHGERDKNGKKRGRGEHDANAPLNTILASPEYGVVGASLVGVGGRAGQSRPRGVDEPSATSTTKADTVLVAPHITKFRANSVGSGGEEPMPTVTANSYIKRPGGAPPLGVVSAFLAQHNIDGRTGNGNAGRSAEEPVSTVLQSGSHQGVIAAHLDRQFGASIGTSADEPAGTTTAGGGGKSALIATHMLDMHGSDMRSAGSDEPLRSLTAQGFHAAHVAAFLTKYYGTDQDPKLGDPMHTATTKDRFGLITVEIEGEPYIIADIGMRMLTPRELFRAQGFPDSYIIDPVHDGKKLTKTAQIRMCGNSVCPQVAEALARANLVDEVGDYVNRGRAPVPFEHPLWQEDAA